MTFTGDDMVTRLRVSYYVTAGSITATSFNTARSLADTSIYSTLALATPTQAPSSYSSVVPVWRLTSMSVCGVTIPSLGSMTCLARSRWANLWRFMNLKAVYQAMEGSPKSIATASLSIFLWTGRP